MRISDWSSDVCSSDLKATGTELYSYHASYIAAPIHPITVGIREERSMITGLSRPAPGNGAELIQTRQIRPPNRSDCPVACSGKTGNQPSNLRSEERRVGKECVSTCRSRGSPSK